MSFIKEEFSWKKLALNCENPSQFTSSQWIRSPWLFLIYRWLVVLYWFIGPVLAYRHDSEIYTKPGYMGPAANTRSWSNLTFWCIVVLEADFLLAALICCVVPCVRRCKRNKLSHDDLAETKATKLEQSDDERGDVEALDNASEDLNRGYHGDLGKTMGTALERLSFDEKHGCVGPVDTTEPFSCGASDTWNYDLGKVKGSFKAEFVSYDERIIRVGPSGSKGPFPCKDVNENLKTEENLEKNSNDAFNNNISFEQLSNKDSNDNLNTTENKENKLFTSFKNIKGTNSVELLSYQELNNLLMKRNHLKPLSHDINKTLKFTEHSDREDVSNKIINAKNKIRPNHVNNKHICQNTSNQNINNKFTIDINEGDSKTKTHLPWYCQLSWLLTNINSSIGVLVSVIYFGILHDETRTIGAFDLHLHGLTTVFIVVDNVVSARPSRLLHFVYPLGFGLIYFIFSAIFWSCDKENNVNYRVILDWNVPGRTFGCCVGLALLIVVIHAALFVIYRLKIFLHSKVCKSIF